MPWLIKEIFFLIKESMNLLHCIFYISYNTKNWEKKDESKKQIGSIIYHQQ